MSFRRFPRAYAWLLAALCLLLDQGTKFWAEAALAENSRTVVPGFFDLVLRGNTGIAFSFFLGGNRWLAVATGALIGAVAYVGLRRRLVDWTPHLVNVAAAFIAAGAVGNWIDRVRLGCVVDFLDFYWRGHHYPTFNVADSCITVGVFLLLGRSLIASRAAAR
ncbi:MAG: signal peptidase II [Verrucomicrobium sp.]|nr:signal peptidase II [Verrucomicrobium sp.]